MKTFPLVSSLAAAAAIGISMLGDAHAADAPATPSVVLVHGAFADGSDWAKVIPLLQARGIHVTADDFALFFQALILATGILAVLLSPSYLRATRADGAILAAPAERSKFRRMPRFRMLPAWSITLARRRRPVPQSHCCRWRKSRLEGRQDLEIVAHGTHAGQRSPVG